MYFFSGLLSKWKRDPSVRKRLTWKTTGPERKEKLAATEHFEKTVTEHLWQIHQSSNMPLTFIPNLQGNLFGIWP